MRYFLHVVIGGHTFEVEFPDDDTREKTMNNIMSDSFTRTTVKDASTGRYAIVRNSHVSLVREFNRDDHGQVTSAGRLI